MIITNVSPPNLTSRPADSALRLALSQKGLRYVGTRGNTNSHVCILGEAPGEKEDAKGLPFVGPSGYLLDAMLKEGGFSVGEYWLSNPFKTRPPDNKMDRLHEIGIPTKLYLDQFWEELEHYKPTIIITCGKTPTNLLCPFTIVKQRKKTDEKKDGFGVWRGSLLTSSLINWPHYVIPMYHPAFVLRQYSEREICIFILQRAFEEYVYWRTHKVLQPLPVRNITTSPSYDVLLIFLQRCLASPSPISVDIELLRRKVPYTISLAISPHEAISFSFWNYQIHELVIIWRLLDEVLKTKVTIWQNGTTFDATWLRALGFSPNLSLFHDTLVRHHILWAGLRHKLEFQTMQYTRQPYYKIEGHNWTPKQGIDRLMRYNCLDTLVTYEIYNCQEAEFAERS